MIPLSDASRRSERFPAVTVTLVAINVAMFGLELAGGEAFVLQWAAVPNDMGSPHGWVTLMTAMFLHAGPAHIFGNMVFFWAFGPVIEDAMGRGRFLMFYLLGGLVAFAGQIAIDPTSTVPTLGASGAIAAVMGGFLVTYPEDRIKTIVPLGFYITVMAIPASVLIGVWLLSQLLNEAGALVATQSGGVAYVAHIAGAVFGMLSARLFESHHFGPRVPQW